MRVTDFGLARSAIYADESGDSAGGVAPKESAAPAGSGGSAAAAALDSPLTEEGMVVGTPRFLPPEQIAGGRADHRSDQFSFCVSLYEALYGTNPFAGRNLEARFDNMVRGALVPPDPRFDRAPPTWVRGVLARGLSVRPEARYPNMSALLEALSWRTRQRRQLLLSAGSLLASALVVAMTVLFVWPYYVCRGSTRKLASVWNAEKKRGLPEALVASIDHYLADWVPAYKTACLASQRDARHAAVLDCLQRRKEDVQALIEIAESTESAQNPLLLSRALEAPYRLPSIRACVSAVHVPPAAPLPAQAAARAELSALFPELSRVRVRLALEQCDKAELEARGAVARARRIHYKPDRKSVV